MKRALPCLTLVLSLAVALPPGWCCVPFGDDSAPPAAEPPPSCCGCMAEEQQAPAAPAAPVRNCCCQKDQSGKPPEGYPEVGAVADAWLPNASSERPLPAFGSTAGPGSASPRLHVLQCRWLC